MSGNWRGVLVALAAVLGLGVTMSLGFWQLDRAAQKERLQAAIEARGAMPVLDATSLLAPVAAGELLQRRVEAVGRWLPQHTVLLDNRQMQARPGFYVLTPLQLEGRDAVVLVQRGWVARDFQDRSRVPQFATADGLVRVQGRVIAEPSRIYQLGDSGAAAMRQNLDLAQYSRQTGLALAPLTVLQTDGPADGLLRDWPAVETGVDKHYGYAFQWFGLSALILVLYVWFQIVKRHVRSRR